MHDLIFAIAFVAMVATPAMVATWGSRKEYSPTPESAPRSRAVTASPRQGVQVVRPLSAQASAQAIRSPRPPAQPTLPLHPGRGMQNR